MPANTAEPAASRSRWSRNRAEGLATSLQAQRRHLEHADLVGRAIAVLDAAQDAEGVAGVALEIEHGVDHVLDDARAGDLAVLGDVADQHHGGAGFLGKARQRLRRGAHLGDGAGRGIDAVGPQRLDRIDDDEVGRRALLQRRQDDLDIGLAGELHIGVAEAEPLRAQPDLRHRLFARDIDDALAANWRAPPRPAAAGSTCRCPDRRRPARPSP